jgi:hypothetical protein
MPATAAPDVLADVTDRGLGRLNWADSRPTGVSQGPVGIDRRPGIRCYALSSSPPVADYWGLSGWRRSYVARTLFGRRDHRTAGGSNFESSGASSRRSRLLGRKPVSTLCVAVSPACGQAEGLRLLDLPGRTEDADQVCAAAILQDEPMRLISRDRETTCEQNGTSQIHRKRQDKKQTSPKQAHNLAHQRGCNIGIKYFDLLLTNT